jgi:uncharacterized protein YjdB
MARYQIAWHATNRIATVQAYGDAKPAGSTVLGNFYHNQSEDTLGDNPVEGHTENHVLYHHVRDALYKIGVEDMARLTIDLDIIYVAVTGVALTPDPFGTFAVGATRQLTATISPGGASNTAVTYTSSDPTKATVSATGLVTAVAIGTTNITVTTNDGAFTDVVAVEVTAP